MIPVSRSQLLFHSLAAILATFLVAVATLEAADMTFKLSSREGYVAAPIFLEMTVSDATDLEPPAAPAIEGADVRLMPGSRTMTSTSIINGRATTSTSTTFVFEIVPRRAGRFVIPPVMARADGQEFQTPALPFVVNQSETGDLLKVEVKADPTDPLVGEESLLTLRILVRPYREEAARISADEETMWGRIQRDRSEFGYFKPAMIELDRQRQRPAGREELVGDVAYFVYEVSRPWRPSAPGPADLGPIEIVVDWPTGTRRVADLFGRQTVEISGVRPVTASPDVSAIAARPLPEAGRPDDFTGAIGRFTVDASAKPTDVAVGDPITVTFRVTSDDPGSLEGVRLPPFHRDPAISAMFRIPADEIAGSIVGNVKTFTQTFRPLADSVKEIPPLRLSYFDPERNGYATVASAPIPIAVSPSERLALNRIVSASGAEPAVTSAPGLTPVAGGLLANAARDELVRSFQAGDRSPGLATLAATFAVPPLVFGAVAVIAATRARRERDPLRTRAKAARRNAERRLAAGDADAGFDALAGLVADRLGLPEGRRTRHEVAASLESAGVEADLRRRTAETLRSLESARYGPAGSATDPGPVRSLIAELDRALPFASVANGGGR
jgi:hypothetical protein